MKPPHSTAWQVAAERAFGAFADAVGLKPLREGSQAAQRLWLAQCEELGAYAGFAQLAATAWLDSVTRLPGLALGGDAQPVVTPLGLLRLWSAELDKTLHAAMLSERGLDVTAAAVRATSRRKIEAQGLADLKREALGDPSRREMDDAHREIQALKRELRQLKQALVAGKDTR